MLASDRERDTTVRRLRAAHLDGRIDDAELEERVGRAHAARTRAELEALAGDLPEGPPALALTHGLPRLPGRRHFEERKLVDEAALAALVPALERRGFRLAREEAGMLVFAHRRELASQITVRLHDTGDGRRLLHAHGFAPLAARRALASLPG